MAPPFSRLTDISVCLKPPYVYNVTLCNVSLILASHVTLPLLICRWERTYDVHLTTRQLCAFDSAFSPFRVIKRYYLSLFKCLDHWNALNGIDIKHPSLNTSLLDVQTHEYQNNRNSKSEYYSQNLFHILLWIYQSEWVFILFLFFKKSKSNVKIEICHLGLACFKYFILIAFYLKMWVKNWIY